MIEWLATLNDDVDTCALSPLKLTVPNDVAPSKNSILPVGVVVTPLTCAVNVTELPYVDGLLLEDTVVVVFALFTV